jgi:sulfur carrier protein ThiS
MIKINLKLFVTLSKYLPRDNDPLEISEHTTVEDLMADLGIPGDLVKLIFVNGKREGRDCLLHQGDRVGLFPPVGGG